MDLLGLDGFGRGRNQVVGKGWWERVQRETAEIQGILRGIVET